MWCDDFIDIDTLRETLDRVLMNSARFSLDDCVPGTSSFFPDQLESQSDQTHGTIADRRELRDTAELTS
jgi:hypothetical protein